MRFIVIGLLCLPLQGCWFIFFPIPGSLFESGNTCVAQEHAKVGQRINRHDGKSGDIVSVIGRHQRCQEGERPMLVEVKFD